jgi:hypothetical protein
MNRVRLEDLPKYPAPPPTPPVPRRSMSNPEINAKGVMYTLGGMGLALMGNMYGQKIVDDIYDRVMGTKKADSDDTVVTADTPIKSYLKPSHTHPKHKKVNPHQKQRPTTPPTPMPPVQTMPVYVPTSMPTPQPELLPPIEPIPQQLPPLIPLTAPTSAPTPMPTVQPTPMPEKKAPIPQQLPPKPPMQLRQETIQQGEMKGTQQPVLLTASSPKIESVLHLDPVAPMRKAPSAPMAHYADMLDKILHRGENLPSRYSIPTNAPYNMDTWEQMTDITANEMIKK